MTRLLVAGLLLWLAAGCETNQPPRIVALSVSPTRAAPSESVTIRAEAYDPEAGRIIYKWRADGGTFGENRDSLIVWYAPEIPGNYKVWLTVVDALGARNRRSVTLQVVGAVPGAGRLQLDTTVQEVKRRPRVAPPRRPGGRQTGRTNPTDR